MTWRELVVPQPIAAFISDIWMTVNVDVFNDETAEVKVFAPGHSTYRLVLDRSRYRPLDASAFPGELRDLGHPTLKTGSSGEGRKERPTRADGYRIPLGDRDAAVLSVLAAHPGRLFQKSELAAAAWGGAGADGIVELEQTVARIQQVLRANPETLELVETGNDGPQYRLLVPHRGPGTGSSA
jgi:hypothetical protein